MKYSLEAGIHSADKDHEIMTGGTLSVDKRVGSPGSGIELYTYTLPFFPQTETDTSFHRALHSIEHLIAYSKDSGSLRSSLEEVSIGCISGKMILDISPFRNTDGVFGFRVTSLEKLDIPLLQTAVKISIQTALKYLNIHQSVPFAEAKKCGQYDFHDIKRASELLSSISLPVDISENRLSTKHNFAYVCDLRFLKPKLEGKNDMVMFSPEFSYHISHIIEKYLPEKFSESLVIVGTFGCMTGMYLCVSSHLGDNSDIATIHRTIIQVLQEHIDQTTLSEVEQTQFQTLIENYIHFSSVSSI